MSIGADPPKRPARPRAGRGRVEAGRVEAGRVEAGRVEAGRVEAGRVEAGRVGSSGGAVVRWLAALRRGGSGLPSLAMVLTAAAAIVVSTAPRVPAAAAEASGVADVAVTEIIVPTPPTEPSAEPAESTPRKATCAAPQHGLGSYRDWITLERGKLLVPDPPPDGAYDLVLHFHGGGTAGGMLAPLDLGLVIATVDAGVGSQAYAEAMPDATAFEQVLATVAEQLPPSARRDKLIVTSWSAGYGAVRQLLLTAPDLADAVVLLDGLHAGYEADGAVQTAGLEPFVAYATRARDRDRLMVVTHSSIRPPGYASTTETASYLLERVGGRRSYAALHPVAGVEQLTNYQDGGLTVRGFTGTSKEAHCAQIQMIGGVVRDDILPRLRN